MHKQKLVYAYSRVSLCINNREYVKTQKTADNCKLICQSYSVLFFVLGFSFRSKEEFPNFIH